jgi:hypothetical protein
MLSLSAKRRLRKKKHEASNNSSRDRPLVTKQSEFIRLSSNNNNGRELPESLQCWILTFVSFECHYHMSLVNHYWSRICQLRESQPINAHYHYGYKNITMAAISSYLRRACHYRVSSLSLPCVPPDLLDLKQMSSWSSLRQLTVSPEAGSIRSHCPRMTPLVSQLTSLTQRAEYPTQFDNYRSVLTSPSLMDIRAALDYVPISILSSSSIPSLTRLSINTSGSFLQYLRALASAAPNLTHINEYNWTDDGAADDDPLDAHIIDIIQRHFHHDSHKAPASVCVPSSLRCIDHLLIYDIRPEPSSLHSQCIWLALGYRVLELTLQPFAGSSFQDFSPLVSLKTLTFWLFADRSGSGGPIWCDEFKNHPSLSHIRFITDGSDLPIQEWKWYIPTIPISSKHVIYFKHQSDLDHWIAHDIVADPSCLRLLSSVDG